MYFSVAAIPSAKASPKSDSDKNYKLQKTNNKQKTNTKSQEIKITMTEMTKTMMFVAAAVVSLLLAFAIQPGGTTFDVQQQIGEILNQFDTEAPKRLKIVKFDQATATVSEFEVAEQDSLWVIPSKDDYPADAERQMGESANSVIDLEILRIAAKNAEQHAELGVLSPAANNLNSKTSGVGTRVVMSDGKGDTLVDMIVGKEVKDASDQHYVRNTDQDIVYVVELDPSGLSTKFDDWIEGDLLKLNPMDIRRAEIKDYSAELLVTLAGAQVNWDQRGEFSLRYDNSESKWNAESLQKFDKTAMTYVEDQIGENEELNTDALRELKNGLDDLVIVDVLRKPEGLSADLKAGSDFLKNEAAGSLARMGFAPVALAEGTQPEILSSEGELTCTLQNGVEYVLRFGNLQIDSGEVDGESESATGESGETAEDDGINRYLFVMTRFNQDIIEQPKLDELPALPEGAPEENGENADDASQDASTGHDSDTGEVASAEVEPETGEAAPSADAESDADTEVADPQTNESDAVENVADAEKEADEEKDAQEDELEEILAQRKRIVTENKRREDEYQQKIEDGKQQVQELNERFGDWYYVISNDVYKKIHLGREQLVSEKEKEESDDQESKTDDNPLSGLPNLTE